MRASMAGREPKKQAQTLPSLPSLLFLLLLTFSWFGESRAQDQILVQEEVDILKVIASKLKKEWDFNVEPCSGSSGWVDVSTFNTNVVSNLTCGECNNTSQRCHVISIQLKGQNLTGVLPDEFANLTHLTNLDLTRNYLNGAIPTSWASLPLFSLSLIGNRISGTIPEELGRIITLQNLELEANLLQGQIPGSLGKLINLNRLHISSNNFSGELPELLGNLKNITDFRIDGNPISGKIPSFIGNWTQLRRFDIQGTSLQGPFPPIFSTLKGITELRASYWKGGDGKFPPLQNMAGMKSLILRNLSLSGQIPYYLGAMSSLNYLDLSFNNLTGPIPSSFDPQKNSINYMYLSNNMLSGTIPDWIFRSKENLDLSYNNFAGPSTASNCQQGNVILVASYSSVASNQMPTCFRKGLPCSEKAKNYEVFINCGGSRVTIGDQEYEEDETQLGASRFEISESKKWAYSSTGEFLGNENTKYIATNSSKLNMTNPAIYMTARLSPLALRYYGLCLQNGNYTVNLHFAEIILTSDQTFASVGRRIFDVSIQGERVLQDFNIAKEANGTGQEIIKTFTTVVSDNTLEILFQWTGKGTMSIPRRSVYGPLISAISITPNFKPDTGANGLSIGAIVGIVLSSCLVIFLILIFLCIWFRRKRHENSELKGLQLQTGYFTLRQIKAATKNFDPAYKIGEGGFGPVYKGTLPDGSLIAVKQLSSNSKQGNREFINEIGMISALQHPNLVKLFGCCIEGNQLLLVYEYMENNSLARALFGPKRSRLDMDWQTRMRICLGIARGLSYLHEESSLRIVHRDVKATNILLDKDLNAKISDFGLARLHEDENTHISTRIAGTVGYMAPEYAMRGYLTDKADVYSFGVVTLEIASGMSNANYKPKEEFVYLLDWAYVLKEQGNLLELMDPHLDSNYPKEEAEQMLNLSLLCTNPSPTLRPTMSSVVSMLEGKKPVAPPVINKAASKTEEVAVKSFMRHSRDTQTSGMSMDGPWTDSMTSNPSSKERSHQNSTTSKLLSDTDSFIDETK